MEIMVRACPLKRPDQEEKLAWSGGREWKGADLRLQS
jgi:hypothetical protein